MSLSSCPVPWCVIGNSDYYTQDRLDALEECCREASKADVPSALFQDGVDIADCYLEVSAE